MNLRRLVSPLALGLFVLAIPLLIGAKGDGCGDVVVVKGDGGGGSAGGGQGDGPKPDASCAANTLFLDVHGDGADQKYTFADCYTGAPPSGSVEAYIVHHLGAPTGLAIRSCSGEVAWLTLYGESGDTLPGALANATTDYVNPSGAERGTKDTAVNISFFGEVGQIVEGTFTSHLDVGPEAPITLTGSFRACRAGDGQDP
jgi:hypothetical protein